LRLAIDLIKKYHHGIDFNSGLDGVMKSGKEMALGAGKAAIGFG
jgi:hypothetical protein